MPASLPREAGADDLCRKCTTNPEPHSRSTAGACCLHSKPGFPESCRQPTLIVTLTTTVGRCLALRALLLPQVDCSGIPNSVAVAGVCQCAATGFNVTALSNSTLLACLPSSSSTACPPAYPLPTRQGATGPIQSCSTANSVCPSGSLTLVNAAYKSVECRVGAVACPAAYPVTWFDYDKPPILACAPANSTCPPRSYPTLGGRLALSVYDAQYKLVQCSLKSIACYPPYIASLLYTVNASDVSNQQLDGCSTSATCPPSYPVSLIKGDCLKVVPAPSPSPAPVRAGQSCAVSAFGCVCCIMVNFLVLRNSSVAHLPC